MLVAQIMFAVLVHVNPMLAAVVVSVLPTFDL